MHHIGFLETIFMIFRLWTVSSYSYIKRLPPVSSCFPDALNVFKTAKFRSSWIDLCQRTYKSRYWICRDYDYGFPSLDSVSVIIAISLPQFMDFQQAFDTGVLTTQHIMPNCAPVQMTYASRAIMHDIEFVETIVIIFQPWIVSFYSYIERQPPVSSCAPGIFNAFKTAKFCFSSIDPCQQSHHAWYWFCRDHNYGISTLDSFFLFLCRQTAPSEQLCSWRT